MTTVSPDSGTATTFGSTTPRFGARKYLESMGAVRPYVVGEGSLVLQNYTHATLGKQNSDMLFSGGFGVEYEIYRGLSLASEVRMEFESEQYELGSISMNKVNGLIALRYRL